MTSAGALSPVLSLVQPLGGRLLRRLPIIDGVVLDRAAALKTGFQMHLTKPIDPESLVAAVATPGRSRAVVA